MLELSMLLQGIRLGGDALKRTTVLRFGDELTIGDKLVGRLVIGGSKVLLSPVSFAEVDLLVSNLKLMHTKVSRSNYKIPESSKNVCCHNSHCKNHIFLNSMFVI